MEEVPFEPMDRIDWSMDAPPILHSTLQF